MKTVNELLTLSQKRLNPIEVLGNKENQIESLEFDSRRVGQNSIYFALPGVHTDGHNFIESAIKQGASAIVHTKDIDFPHKNICYIRVEDSRKAMSPLSAAFYDFPSKDLKVVGVTGTDGKSTTVSFIDQLLELEGEKSGFLSTVNFKTNGTIQSNPFRQSTPEAPQIHQFLRQMVDAGVKYAILEATSHGLSEKNSRLADVDFDAAVLTNVTHEHLEFHGSIEQYRLDKANLFKMINQSSNSDAFGVINRDDRWAEIYMDALGEKPVFLYSMKNPETDIYGKNYKAIQNHIEFDICLPDGDQKISLNMPGLFNVENAFAALLTVSELLEVDALEIAHQLEKLVGVKGRMSPVIKNQPFSVIVDYAHTPGSFEKILPMIKAETKGKLILLFGSAGERDIEKRSEQGEIADKFADTIILCDEDPRGENSMNILEDIATGITGKNQDENLFLIPDRTKAMKKALSLAKEDDTVLTLGKGHEGSIIYKDSSLSWDEKGTLEKLLEEMGF